MYLVSIRQNGAYYGQYGIGKQELLGSQFKLMKTLCFWYFLG